MRSLPRASTSPGLVMKSQRTLENFQVRASLQLELHYLRGRHAEWTQRMGGHLKHRWACYFVINLPILRVSLSGSFISAWNGSPFCSQLQNDRTPTDYIFLHSLQFRELHRDLFKIHTETVMKQRLQVMSNGPPLKFNLHTSKGPPLPPPYTIPNTLK